jgi:GAF domain-containing protein
LIIPLRYKGKLAGVLTTGSKGTGEPYVQSDIDLLEALAGHAAVAIENARLYDEAKRAQESLRESEARLAIMAKQSLERYLSK